MILQAAAQDLHQEVCNWSSKGRTCQTKPELMKQQKKQLSYCNDVILYYVLGVMMRKVAERFLYIYFEELANA